MGVGVLLASDALRVSGFREPKSKFGSQPLKKSKPPCETNEKATKNSARNETNGDQKRQNTKENRGRPNVIK